MLQSKIVIKIELLPGLIFKLSHSLVNLSYQEQNSKNKAPLQQAKTCCESSLDNEIYNNLFMVTLISNKAHYTSPTIIEMNEEKQNRSISTIQGDGKKRHIKGKNVNHNIFKGKTTCNQKIRS